MLKCICIKTSIFGIEQQEFFIPPEITDHQIFKWSGKNVHILRCSRLNLLIVSNNLEIIKDYKKQIKEKFKEKGFKDFGTE